MPDTPAAYEGLAGAGRTWLGGLGVVTVSAALVWLAGPVGLLVGAAVAAGWYGLSGPFAVAAGHVLLLALLAGRPDPAGLLVLEAGFLAILAAPMAGLDDPVPPLAVTAGVGLVLGLLAWFGWTAWEPRWLVGVALVAVVAVALYGLHRYQVVQLENRGVARPP